MWRIINLLILCISTLAGCAQKQFPAGVYLNKEQLHSAKPAYQADFTVVPNSSRSGGILDYTLVPNSDTIPRGAVRRGVYAYVKNDSLFINCGMQKLAAGFAYVVTPGNFLVFKANTAIRSNAAGDLRRVPEPWCILSLRTGNMRVLKQDYLTERLREFPSLLDNYRRESSPNAPETMIKYVALLNKEVPVNMGTEEKRETTVKTGETTDETPQEGEGN